MDKEILNMDEAAELFNVSIKTFIKILKEEKVPARKIGREWRFSRTALIGWLSAGDSQAYSSSDTDTKEFFNSVAANWEKISEDYYDESVRGILLESGLLEPNIKVADIGSGSGFLSRAIAGKVGSVIAIDISAEMLGQLSAQAITEGLSNIKVLEADGCEIPLPAGVIDLICSNMYLHHIDDPLCAVKEMKRLLKPGGKVFLADLKEHMNRELTERMHDAWPGFKPEELKSWFKKSGFKNIKVEFPGDKKGMLILTASA